MFLTQCKRGSYITLWCEHQKINLSFWFGRGRSLYCLADSLLHVDFHSFHSSYRGVGYHCKSLDKIHIHKFLKLSWGQIKILVRYCSILQITTTKPCLLQLVLEALWVTLKSYYQENPPLWIFSSEVMDQHSFETPEVPKEMVQKR